MKPVKEKLEELSNEIGELTNTSQARELSDKIFEDLIELEEVDHEIVEEFGTLRDNCRMFETQIGTIRRVLEGANKDGLDKAKKDAQRLMAYLVKLVDEISTSVKKINDSLGK
jgi:hypothetical protein